MPRLDSFLRLVVEQKASDLHFVAGSQPIIRYNGDLVTIPFRELSELETRRFVWELLSEEQRETFDATGELDFAYELTGVGRFRTNLFRQRKGIGAVFRVIPDHPPELRKLTLPSSVKRFIELRSGLVLVTGPTGSGKTTTLAALVNEINQTRRRHIITIEDPIEFMHTPVRSLITQRQVHKHAASFAGALRSALRESPDVLLVGEMRDLETINLAVNAAETGALVLATLHTSSAAKSVDRIVDAYPEAQAEQVRSLLSVVLRGVVSQQLVKLASGDGRVAAAEVMLSSYATSNMIREGKTYQIDALLQSADPGSGMQSMDQALVRLVRRRLVSLEEALRVTNNPVRIKELCGDEGELMGDPRGADDAVAGASPAARRAGAPH